MEDEIEIVETPCSYQNSLGETINTCKDFPVTYCSKCECFHVLDREGNRIELLIQMQKGISG